MATLDSSAGLPESSSIPGSLLKVLTALPKRSDNLVAVVNGLFGDALDDGDSHWATQMTIRLGDTVLPTDRQALRDTLSTVDVAPRICVFVHGLMSTESVWNFAGDKSTTFGTLLADDHDVTVLSVRYNTGRHISDNGRELAHLLNHLVSGWPVRVREINLIGHSMGGLVIRSAGHYARRQRTQGRRLPFGRRWTSKVRRVVLIGVPNTGAGLEAVVHSASAALWALPIPTTRLVGLGLDQRSAGIKDLRFGAILEEDWAERDPGARRRSFRHLPDRLNKAEYLVIGGTVTTDPEHPMAKVLGDALVAASSTSGRSTDGELFPQGTTRTFPKITHIALAHHPDVYEAIADWWPTSGRR